jgi:hypothetical protein
MTEPVAAPKVYAAMGRVLAAMAEEGIQKNRRGQDGAYRGIDDVYNVLSQALAKNALLVTPTAVNRYREERPREGKGPAALAFVEVTYTFISCEDGSKHDVVMHAEAIDFGDKSIGKAFSYAYKQMAFQCFCIPIEGHSPDSDDDKPELPPKQPAKTTPRAQVAQQPQPASAASRAQPSGDNPKYKNYWTLFRNSSHVAGTLLEDGTTVGPFRGQPIAELDDKALGEYIVRLEKGLATQTEKAKATHADARLYLAAATAEHERRTVAQAPASFSDEDPGPAAYDGNAPF